MIRPLSDTPIPAKTVLPTEPDHMHIMNRYKYSTSIELPSLTIVGKTMYMYDPLTRTRTIMPVKYAQVLQGFAYSMDIGLYIEDIKKMRLAIGDAVPPPFMYACGITCYYHINRHRLHHYRSHL